MDPAMNSYKYRSEEDPAYVAPEAKLIGSLQAVSSVTLRDYFAAAALQGLLAGEGARRLSPSELAARTYRIADDMLKERAK